MTAARREERRREEREKEERRRGRRGNVMSGRKGDGRRVRRKMEAARRMSELARARWSRQTGPRLFLVKITCSSSILKSFYF